MERVSDPSEALPSRTAVWAAAGRAVGARVSDPRWQNPDRLAEKLLGSAELALLGEDHALAKALRGELPKEQPNRELMAASATMVIRTRFIDQHLHEAVNSGAGQVVILGAGFDTRGYRLQESLHNTQLFEVDHPATQRWKRRRAQEALGNPPEYLHHVPVDFRYDSLEEKLREAGYDPAMKTFFILEGVSMYLPEESVRETFGWIARQAPGNSLVFDFAAQELIDLIEAARKGEFRTDSPVEQAAMERAMLIEKWGEPWIFGIPSNGVQEFLQSCGLELITTMGMASREAAKHYLLWSDNEPLPDVRQMYWIAAAGVPAR